MARSGASSKAAVKRLAHNLQFMTDFAENYEKNGKAAIEILFREKPDKYVFLAASFMPKEIDVTIKDNTLDDIPYADLDKLIGAFRERIAASVASVGIREDQTAGNRKIALLPPVASSAVIHNGGKDLPRTFADGGKSEREDSR